MKSSMLVLSFGVVAAAAHTGYTHTHTHTHTHVGLHIHTDMTNIHRRRKLLAERATARPLFGPCVPPLSLAHLLLSPILNITYYISAVLHSHYDASTSISIQNGIVCCGSVHYPC